LVIAAMSCLAISGIGGPCVADVGRNAMTRLNVVTLGEWRDSGRVVSGRP
jgi:hypothetical protein